MARPTEALIDELEPLTHAQRVQRMVELGRRAGSDTIAASLLRQLEDGDTYARWLAVAACFGSFDPDPVLRALADSSRLVRAWALRLVTRTCNDAQAEQAFHRVHRSDRKRLARYLVKHGRRSIVDAFLASFSQHTEPDFVALLPFATPSFVRRYLVESMSVANRSDWQRLANSDAVVAADELERLLMLSEDVDARLQWLAYAVVPAVASRAPDRALQLVGQLLERGVPLAGLDLRSLANRRPSGLADLLLASDASASVSLARRARALSDEQLANLARRRPNALGPWSTWLRRLPAERRAALYNALGAGWRDTEGVVSSQLVALLPRSVRESEGRRHLDWQVLVARTAQRLPYAAFLPWAEARTILQPFIHNPDADLRSVALGTLVFAARYHRDRLAEVLSLLHERRNEQDPVRRAFMSALAALPPGVWQSQHLDGLDAIIRDALDAADLSPATAQAAEQIVLRSVPFHSVWAAEWLAVLVRERGGVSSRRLEANLTDTDARRIAPLLLPILRTWREREQAHSLVSISTSFGRRLRVFDDLVALLEDALRTTASDYMADAILHLVARHRPDRLAALVPPLLAADPSWERRPDIFRHLHRHRQDLITPHLGQNAHAGRFATGYTRFIARIHTGFDRWTPRQQALFATTLGSVTGEPTRDTPSLFAVIAQLAALQFVAPERLIELAAVDNPMPGIRDAALRALARLDGAQGVPTLLQAMDDDRARVAIYALRHSLLELPADRALNLLIGIPSDKVTVAKEVVRLIGELRSDNAYQELLRWDARDLQRDVRVALLRALWDYPEQDTAWTIIEAAARSADPAIAAGVVRVPADRLSASAQARLVGVLGLLLRHPDAKVRLDTLARCASIPIADPDRILLDPLLESLESGAPDEVSAAAGAIFATYAHRQALLVGQAVERVRGNRRTLQAIVNSLESSLVLHRRRLAPTVREVIRALASDPLTASLRARLAVVGMPAEESLAVLAALAADGLLHADALLAVMHALFTPARRDPDGIARFETAAAASQDERLRRLAVAALSAAATTAQGWDDAALARLHTYRLDTSSLVAAAAQFTLPFEA